MTFHHRHDLRVATVLCAFALVLTSCSPGPPADQAPQGSASSTSRARDLALEGGSVKYIVGSPFSVTDVGQRVRLAVKDGCLVALDGRRPMLSVVVPAGASFRASEGRWGALALDGRLVPLRADVMLGGAKVTAGQLAAQGEPELTDCRSERYLVVVSV